MKIELNGFWTLVVLLYIFTGSVGGWYYLFNEVF